MSGRDFLTLAGLGASRAAALADRAAELARLWAEGRMPPALAGRRVALIPDLPGWRNPAAIELGTAAMGGHCVTVPIRMDGGEPAEDVAAYLGNWTDLAAIRTPSPATLERFAAASPGPVINLRTNQNHPVEVLADLAFLRARHGRWDGLRVAVAAPDGNIARSWAEAAEVLPIHVVQIAPPELALGQGAAHLSSTDDPDAMDGADLIVTDCWPAAVPDATAAALARLRVDAARLDRAGAGTLFVPCPPVTRGQEVSEDAMTHPACVVTEAKAWLLHLQNAWLEWAAGTGPA